MKKRLLVCFLLCITFTAAIGQSTLTLNKGKLKIIESFHSKLVSSRRIDIWLPENYGNDSSKKYAVIYMHDGQNLFMTNTAYGGVEWKVDETVSEMMSDHKIKDCIVVGIWNSPKRMREYEPSKPFSLMSDTLQKKLSAEFKGTPLGDQYLEFIATELKPYIDAHFLTLTDAQNTAMIGSSMGGLISFYAICEYPQLFGAVACMSTHWPVSLKFNDEKIGDAYLKYISAHLPSNENHKIYFDYGTKTLDSLYTPYQIAVDKVMHDKWPNGHWTSIKFVEDEHTELFWQRRFGIPLEYLMGL
ncbi:alpha/beta fold hydrolase [Solitalea sp. MAHUQ-68]|uniref:Alpha/beta fold hydrolase n=1 Tax=Solitalea agri TaxID=2953739 RepID=A0A9X2EZU9_9SPHI|nr:alpha/beta fold hydrolase [Solitalea agri]MCO4292079.1 alpha/beta fold hydrolase [Solitalea agri]